MCSGVALSAFALGGGMAVEALKKHEYKRFQTAVFVPRAGSVIGFHSHNAAKAPDTWWMSNFADSKFNCDIGEVLDMDAGPTFEAGSSEQGIMVAKAMLMNDMASANLIIAAESPRECKSLGRKIQGFDQALWNERVAQVAYRVLFQKFEQNEHLGGLLMDTKEQTIAEASPHDAIWGIKLKPSDPRVQEPAEWLGTNLLGNALMQVRAALQYQLQEVAFVREWIWCS